MGMLGQGKTGPNRRKWQLAGPSLLEVKNKSKTVKGNIRWHK